MKAVRSLRQRLGLSQVDFGRLLGVHTMTVSKWERGLLEPNEHQRGVLRALHAAADQGLKASALGCTKFDPLRFLAEALSQARATPELDLGTLSATNRYPGKIVEISRGDVMSKVVIEIAPKLRMGAVITTDSVDRLGLLVGTRAIAIVKATEVIVGKG
jgi:molybdopterin-binding protein